MTDMNTFTGSHMRRPIDWSGLEYSDSMYFYVMNGKIRKLMSQSHRKSFSFPSSLYRFLMTIAFKAYRHRRISIGP
jgi:hypothetical protein